MVRPYMQDEAYDPEERYAVYRFYGALLRFTEHFFVRSDKNFKKTRNLIHP